MQVLQDRICGPRELLRVEDAAAYRAWATRTRVQIGFGGDGKPLLHDSAVGVPAHVSNGRWVVDCPCGSAGLAQPEWGIGICVDCGTVHAAVIFPTNRANVEAVLLARPNHLHRNYFPDPETAARRGLEPSTVAAEMRENRKNGDPTRRRDKS